MRVSGAARGEVCSESRPPERPKVNVSDPTLRMASALQALITAATSIGTRSNRPR